MQEAEIRRITVQVGLDKIKILSPKQPEQKRAGGMAQAVEYLP
jgi:anti-anti-sigma regulatory factor